MANLRMFTLFHVFPSSFPGSGVTRVRERQSHACLYLNSPSLLPGNQFLFTHLHRASEYPSQKPYMRAKSSLTLTLLIPPSLGIVSAPLTLIHHPQL